MGNLVMAVGTMDGIVLAADSRYDRLGPDNPNIRQLTDTTAVLIEPHVGLGNHILDEALSRSDADEFDSLHGFVEHTQATARELAVTPEGQPPTTGLIFCGLTPETEPSYPEIYGIHGAREGYSDARRFFPNAFGGPIHAITRYLADRLTRHRPTTRVAIHFSALAIQASQEAFGSAVEPFSSFATIRASEGFNWAESTTVHRVMNQTSECLARLPMELSSLFLEEADSGGVYKLESR